MQELTFNDYLGGLIVLDHRLSVVQMNREAEEIVEYSHSELKKNGIEVLTDSFFVKLTPMIESLSDESFIDTIMIITKSSKEKFIQRKVKIIKEKSKMKQLLISFFDLTQYKQMEQDYFNYQKLESLKEVTRAISLEYNNLLAAILGFSSFLKGMMNPSNEMYGYLDIIENSANKASSLTNQLLSFSGNEYFKQSYKNINHIIEQNVDLFQKTFPSGIKLSTHLWNEELLIYWDENQLNQVIINTILNAKEAIEAKETKTGTIEIQTTIDNQTILYQIIDDGIGIRKEYADKIFEPYFTTKEVGKHSGLGLSVTQGIIKNLGGSIECDQLDGKTRFTIRIPYTSVDLKKIRMQDLNGNNEKILIVDDVDAMRNLATILLKQKNYQPFAADNGYQGMNIIKNEGIDLVLLDIMMPEINGVDVFKMIKKEYPEMPVILLTGCTDEEIVQNLVRDGSAGLIVKPFETFDFYNKIYQALDQKRSHSN